MGKNSKTAGVPERRGSGIYDSEKNTCEKEIKIIPLLVEKEQKNSKSLKMEVKILHGRKMGVRIVQCLKRGGGCQYSTPDP